MGEDHAAAEESYDLKGHYPLTRIFLSFESHRSTFEQHEIDNDLKSANCHFRDRPGYR